MRNICQSRPCALVLAPQTETMSIINHNKNKPARLLFEQACTDTISESALRMQAHSAFVSAPAFFIELPSHLPLAVLRQLAAGGPLTGRFVSWELRGAELVVRCAIDALDVAHGAPSCTVGNVQGIDPTQRLDFIAAVGEAFPLTAESTFLCALEQSSDGAEAPVGNVATTPAPTPAPAPAPAPPRSAAAPMSKAARRKAAQKAALEQRLSTLSQQINECKNRLAKKKRKGKTRPVSAKPAQMSKRQSKESIPAPMELMSTALAAIKIKKPRPGARTRNA